MSSSGDNLLQVGGADRLVKCREGGGGGCRQQHRREEGGGGKEIAHTDIVHTESNRQERRLGVPGIDRGLIGH